MRRILLGVGLLLATVLEASEPPNTRFFIPSVGGVQSLYRDFATSPLFYSGMGAQIGMGHLWLNDRCEYTVEVESAFAQTRSQPPRSNYFQTFSSAFFFNFGIYGHYLRNIPQTTSSRFRFLAGGSLRSDANARFNPQLGNAVAGVEVLANAAAVGKVVFDASRREAKTLNLKFKTFALKPVNRQLDFRLNAGMLNFNYRPGYSYVHDSELDGDNTGGLGWLLSEHRWKLNGWRLSTALGFTRYRSNGHAIRVEYRWDAVHAPGRYESFQMASHNLRFVFMFNTSPQRT